ncbi:exophilin-5 isoform X2 [Rana temporaria]|uniref:exophilin-5 isoform X2 n=1 Tax=Rana temporaria TaxID=8407 RepID=UPI001AAD3332|nr:exophilin-5 isoform X2 [Rana temporaria]
MDLPLAEQGEMRDMPKLVQIVNQDSSRMSSSRTYQSPKSSNSGPSFLKIRSPFASLFSFRKSKHEVKLPAQNERFNIFSTLNRPPPNTEPVKKKFEIYQSARSVKQIAGFFESQQKKVNQNIPSDVQLQREAFQVLGDLDQKLAQEQSCSHPLRTSIASTYKYGNTYSTESSHHHTSDSRKEYSTLSSHNARKKVSLGETHTTHATYQPRRFYEMYSIRHRSTSQSEAYSKSIYDNSPSLCSDTHRKPPGFVPISGKFSSSSLDLPSANLKQERIKLHKPRRIPITSIRWNTSSASSQPEVSERPFRTRSALDLTNCGNTSQHNRIFDLYNSNRVTSSGSNDFHKVNYQIDLTGRSSQNSSNQSPTGYCTTDSGRHGSITKFVTQTNSHWEEENKENSFTLNKVTSQPPSCARTKTDKDTEPMDILHEHPALDNHVCKLQDQVADFIFTSNISDPHALNSQTENIFTNTDISAIDTEPFRENLDVGQNFPVDFTIAHETEIKTIEPVKTHSGGLPELEPVEVDVPKASLQSTVNFSSTAEDLRINTEPFRENLDVGENIPVDFTIIHETEKKTIEPVKTHSGGLSELEPMEVDVPKASLHSTVNCSSTAEDLRIVGKSNQKDTSLLSIQNHSSYTGPLFTNQDKATFSFQSSKHVFEPNNIKKDYSPFTNVFTSSKPIGGSDTTSKKLSTDIAERLLMLKSRRGSKDNNLEGYRSDMLKHQKRNASSLPDLIDKENEQCFYTDDGSPSIKNSSLTSVSNTKLSDNARIMCSGNHFSSQNFTSQIEDPNLITLDSLETLNMCSFDPAIDRTSKEKDIPLLERVSFLTDTVTEIDGTKALHMPETDPPNLDIYQRYKALYVNNRSNYVQRGADTNNNRAFSKTVQTPKECSEADGSNSVFISVENQQNIDRGTQDVETAKEMSQNHLNPQRTNKITKINEPPRIQSITIIPNRQIVEERTDKKSSNILKKPLRLAPEPYKKSVNTNEDTNPPFSGGGLKPNIYTCKNLSDDIGSVEINTISEIQQTSKTYSSEGVTERTQIYETCYTDSSKPDVDTVEYHKVVSIYYTLPRKFSKRQSEVSQNNLKNIDQTLETSRAPSALLERILNRCSEAEENHDFSYQNKGKISPSQYTPENVLTKELDSGETPLNQQHLLNFNLIPLQTNLMNKNNTPFPGAGTTPTDFSLTDQFNLEDQFSSLHISESGCGHRGNDLKIQRNTTNQNEYSPTRTSPRHNQNTFYTLPNRKCNLQDLERSILENDVAMARDRCNVYSKREDTFPITPEIHDVILSPTFGYDNLHFTGGCNSIDYQQRQVNNIHNCVEKEDSLANKDSFGGGVIYREDIPSFYKSKSSNRRESHHAKDTSPSMETKLSPQSQSQPYATRPSYNSEFVQKKMKPINAKRFTFSFDNNGQRENSNSRSSESFGECIGQSDVDSPSVFHSPKGNYSSHVDRHYYGQGSLAEGRTSQSSNMYRSKSLKSVNHDYKEEEVEIRRKSDGNFSSKSYGGNMKGRSPSGIYCDNGALNRIHSAEIIDENDNWPDSSMGNEKTPVYTAKAVDYGIFGKEQQEALLNNVKRSLTEGRLWRPSFLKNPNSLRNEDSYQTGCKPDDDLKATLNIYEGVVPPNSESDTDTTTDDEYYLNENDKESEL